MEYPGSSDSAKEPQSTVLSDRVLITAHCKNDAASIAASLRAGGFHSLICEDLAECARQIGRGAGMVLLTGEVFEDARARELLGVLETQPVWSDLPVIILAGGGEERLRGLLELTTPAASMVTLLERPISDAALVRAVHVALSSRLRQYQVRDLLEEQERFRNQVRLREYELRFMIDNAAEMIVYCDREGRYRFCNAPYAMRFGLRPEDVVRKHIREVVGLEAYENFRHHVEAALRGERVDFEQKIPYDAIGPRWIHAVYVPQFVGSDVIGFVGLIKDITVQKEAEEAEARLAAIVASSSDAIVSKTLDGIVTSWNAGAERMFGYSAEEMVGTPISRLIPDEIYGEEERLLASIRAGARVENFETERVRKDRRRLPVSLTISPIRDSSGKLIGVSKIARDITERRAAEEKLRLAKERAEKASRAKDDFLAALSHELRTPLTPVLMAATALQEDSALPEHVREQLRMIARNVSLEARLIDDLLDLTRVARGKLFLCPEPCDTHKLLRLVVEIVRGRAQEKGIEIVLDLNARGSQLFADPARLQQAFWNLLRNAVKFTPVGGCVRVHTFDCAPGFGEELPRICIEVTDDGIGFPPEAGERIFEPFEQVASEERYRVGGMGLGLAITRTVVELHNGIIRAESPGKNLGATFTVELPRSTMTRIASDLPLYGGRPEDRGVERPMRLLVVEDHEPTLQVLSRLLKSAGHTVVAADSVAKARKCVADEPVDLVISDLGLPDGNGIELMKGLRDTYGLRGIALSGFGMEEDFRRSREAGFEAHLVKPVDFNELRRVISQCAHGRGS